MTKKKYPGLNIPDDPNHARGLLAVNEKDKEVARDTLGEVHGSHIMSYLLKYYRIFMLWLF